MRLLVSSLLLGLVAAPLRAQDVEIPAVTPVGFSPIAGKYHIETSAAPTEVHVEEPITLKVRIVGQGPEAHRPQRKNLNIFPDDLGDDFYLEALPERDLALPAKGVWEFVYKLRPKHVDVQLVPSLTLIYYDPDLPEGRRTPTRRSEEIAIKVTPRPERPLGVKTVILPDRFYQLRPAAEVLRDDTPWPRPGLGLLAVLLAVPPLGCFVWYRVWRRLHPDAAERRTRRRSRAARAALSYLETQADGDVTHTRAAVVDYLRQRFDLTPLDPTPDEVARHLRRIGASKTLTAAWAELLQRCDQARFAQVSERRSSEPRPLGSGDAKTLPNGRGSDTTRLTADAMRLINDLEGEACASR